MNRALTLTLVVGRISSSSPLLARRFSSGTGLYGIPLLKTAKGFRRLVDEAIERSGELVSYVSQLPPSDEVVNAMDEISNTVCSVIDAAELCRQTHPDREFVEEAMEASMRIYDHLHYLNTNHSLYNAVLKAEREGVLRTEAHRAAHALRTDFEKGGIHLTAGSVDVYPASRIPKHIQHHLEPIYRSTTFPKEDLLKSEYKKKEKGFRITTDPSTLSLILRWAADSEVRKQAFIMGKSAPRANLAVLDKIICARDELAQTLGCKSYAEFAIHPNMAASPDVVMSFLVDLSTTVRPKADEEFRSIREFKRKMCNEKCADLEPWDEAYFTGMMKSSAYDLNSSIAALVCNFSASPGTSSWLNHCDVETLFHEFGHALHSLLSRTDYQHFSGTRVVLDLAETPSNLFEYYAWDYRVLRTFAKHSTTGDVIPEKLVDAMNSARNMFAATELQRQIYLSIVDLTLFGEQSSSQIDTTSVVADLKTKYTSWKHVEGISWQTRFTHLINYGAGYYSYLYAKSLAATIWQDVCNEDPLSLSTGTAIRMKFLQHGGAKDPVQLLRDFVGNDVLRNCNGGFVPDTSSLCKGMGLRQ